MCLSIFLAQVIGLYLLVVSLAGLIHQNRFKKVASEIMASSALFATVGCKSLLLGLLILIPHDVWVCKWPVLITFIGWVMLIRGLMILLFPAAMVKFFRGLMANKGFLFCSWVWFLIALYLVWLGFTQG